MVRLKQLAWSAILAASIAGCTSLLQDNQPPVAFAGFDQRGDVGEPVELNGAGSYDPEGDSMRYRWTLASAPSAANAQIEAASSPVSLFSADLPGRYVLQLVVSDDSHDSLPDFANVFLIPTESNRPPQADAGADQTLSLGSTASLNGSGSSDPDGDALDYSWSFTSVPATSALTDADLATPSAATASFVPDAAGDYAVSLAVSDGRGGSDTDTVVVTARADGNNPPEADAQANSPVMVDGTAVLDGSGSSDPDGDTLSYSWSFTSVPPTSALTDTDLADRTAAVARFVPDVEGDYTASLIVSDGRGGSDMDTATVTARSSQNRPPEALAQSASPIMLGDLALLDGSGTSDPDGDTLSYTWSFTSLPATSALTDLDIAPNGTTIAISIFEPDVIGTYELSLTADDDRGGTDTDELTIVVDEHQNRDPLAEAGDDVSLMVGEEAWLDGRASSDPDHDEITYSWSFDSVPAGSAIDAGDLAPDSAAAAPSFWPDVEGIYLARLTVDDGLGGSGEDTVTVSVSAPANRTPVAEAGSSLTVQLGSDVVLDGRASYDPDGDTLAYIWHFTARPVGTALTDSDISDRDQPQARFTPDMTGQFRVELTVDDSRENGQDSDEAVFTVTDVPNGAPDADAGPDQVTNKSQPVGLDGSGSSDPDSDLLTYHWSVIERPAGSNVGAASFNPNDDSTAMTPLFTPDRGGVYTVQLLVEDGKGGLDTDEVQVTANNRDPSAAAGIDRTMPKLAPVTLSGSGSDPDGDPLSYAWRFVSKPAKSELVDIDLSPPGSAEVEFTPDHAGDYEIELEVTDGDGGRGTDTVLVRATNLAPTADAGSDMLDARKGAPVLLDGTGSADPEDDPLAYSWAFFTVPASSTLTDADLLQADTARPRFTPDVTGTYIARLTVTDVDEAADSDDVIVTAINQGPTAEAGGPYSVLNKHEVALSGSGSDPDGDPLTYFWSFDTKPGGSTLTDGDIADRDQAAARFTPDAKGEFVLALRVIDSASAFHDDTATVTSQNNPPAALASAPANGIVDEPIALDGTGSSDLDDDALSYVWSFTQLPPGSGLSSTSIQNRTSPAASFTPDVLGMYELRLTVEDTDLASDSFEVDIAVGEGLAITTASAEIPQARECVSYTFDRITADFGTPPYAFSEVGSGLPADLVLESDGRITGTPAAGTVGIYPFTARVTDEVPETADRDLSLQVLINRPPQAEAGDNVSGRAGTALNLAGGGTDEDGNTLSYSWRFVSRAPGSTLQDSDIQARNTATPSFTPDAKGTFVLELRVEDGCNGADTDTVNALATNRDPTAAAEASGAMLPGQAVVLDGSGSSDPDGDSLSYDWTFDSVAPGSGLDNGDISSPSNVTAGFVPDVDGDYVVVLQVNDGDGGVVTNHPPGLVVSIAPEPLVITTESGDLPHGRECVAYPGHTLQASGGHPAYSWEEVGNALTGAGLSLGSGGALSGTPNQGTAGPLGFTARVTDQQPTSTDKGLQLTIDPNRRPTSEAGADQSDSTGATIQMAGSGSDPDGNSLCYSWRFDLKALGSVLTDGDISNADTPTPSFVPDVKGIYVLRMYVADGCGSACPITDPLPDNCNPAGCAIDTAKATALNRAPTANAGPDITVDATGTWTTLPDTGPPLIPGLDGSGSTDPDGDPLTYTWSIDSTIIGTGPTPTVSLLAGTWNIDLQVDDGDPVFPLAHTDRVVVTINEPGYGQSAAYVAKPGNDAGDCTRADPCDTIAVGLNRAGTIAINNTWTTAGCLVAEGTYNERFTVWSAASLYCGFEDTNWTRNYLLHTVDVNTGNDWGIDFEGGTGPDTVVDGCRLWGHDAGDGDRWVATVGIEEGRSPTLRNNLIATGAAAHLQGLYISGGGANPLLEDNVIAGAEKLKGQPGIDVRNRSMSSSEYGVAVQVNNGAYPRFRRNIIIGPSCGSYEPCIGINLDHVRAQLYNNLIMGGYGNNNCSVNFYLRGEDAGVNPHVYHNVILGGQGSGSQRAVCLDASVGSTQSNLELIANVIASASYGVHEATSRIQPARVWNNDFHAATLGVLYSDDDGLGANLDRDLAWINSHFDSGRPPANIAVDPSFVTPNYSDPLLGDWRLQPASLCVDQGAAETVDGVDDPPDPPVPDVPRDFYEDPREADEGGDDQPDIGLDEVY